MKDFLSFSSVIALWLAVSFLFWLGHRLFRRNTFSSRKKLAQDAVKLIDEGQSIFNAIRAPSPVLGPGRAAHQARREADSLSQGEVRGLLNAIESSSPYFDRVNGLKKQIQKSFGLADFAPLSEILQIRRDFWAAAEILLVDDLRHLGPELADDSAYDMFKQEARSLLFRSSGFTPSDAAGEDSVDLRFSVAKDEALRFAGTVREAIEAEIEKERLPRPAEVVSYPIRAGRAVGMAFRAASASLSDFASSVGSLSRAMRHSSTIGWGLDELRKAKAELPGQFATAFEKAGGAARQGGHGLKRHYEFLLEARELQSRYAELLQRAPDMSEKGRQFIARMELAKRAELFRASSEGALSFLRNKLVLAIAFLIAGLQQVQAKITPPQHKQLVLQPGAAQPTAKPETQPVQNPAQQATEQKNVTEAGAGNKGEPQASASSAPPLRMLLPPASLSPKQDLLKTMNFDWLHGDAKPIHTREANAGAKSRRKPALTVLEDGGTGPASAPREVLSGLRTRWGHEKDGHDAGKIAFNEKGRNGTEPSRRQASFQDDGGEDLPSFLKAKPGRQKQQAKGSRSGGTVFGLFRKKASGAPSSSSAKGGKPQSAMQDLLDAAEEAGREGLLGGDASPGKRANNAKKEGAGEREDKRGKKPSLLARLGGNGPSSGSK